MGCGEHPGHGADCPSTTLTRAGGSLQAGSQLAICFTSYHVTGCRAFSTSVYLVPQLLVKITI